MHYRHPDLQKLPSEFCLSSEFEILFLPFACGDGSYLIPRGCIHPQGAIKLMGSLWLNGDTQRQREIQLVEVAQRIFV
jgi:hypothetical protein